MDKSELQRFAEQLLAEEKSAATVEKYLRDARTFLLFADGRLTKETVTAYKRELTGRFAPASVNSMLTAVNGFLRFLGRGDCAVRLLRVQRQIFSREERELSRGEYLRLLKAAKGARISYVIQAICGTGIRVSELKFITAEAVRAGRAVVSCKGKTRVILLAAPVQRLLREYMKKAGVKAGSVFVTRGGKPLDRSNIWKEMKALCRAAGVPAEKVFPHNLRHLFARTFYGIEKDIVRLADLLGHSSVNTTRLYTRESGREHLRGLERVGLLVTT